jgi:Catalase
VAEKSTRDFQDPKDKKEYLAAHRRGGATRQIPDGAAKLLTTILGGIADTRKTLRSGEQDPSLLNDFTTREKITHLDHERIPELIVHGRASIGQNIEAAKQHRLWRKQARLSDTDL